VSHDSERADALRASRMHWTARCSCRPVNRAPYAGTCGTCGLVVEPCCACGADARTRGPGHETRDPINVGAGACQALVGDYGEVCDYCRARCGGAQ